MFKWKKSYFEIVKAFKFQDELIARSLKLNDELINKLEKAEIKVSQFKESIKNKKGNFVKADILKLIDDTFGEGG